MKKHWNKLVAVAAVLWAAYGVAAPGEDAAGLEIGDKAPVFQAIDQDGHLWKSADYVGRKNVVVYFYPAAMTGGCTKQACAFRDDRAKLEELDAVVIGVSGDEPAALKVFQKSYDLNFTLISDHDGVIAKKFGVPLRDGGSLKRLFEGEEVTLTRGVTSGRWTFVFDRDGKLVHKNTEVNAAADSENVRDVLKKLQG